MRLICCAVGNEEFCDENHVKWRPQVAKWRQAGGVMPFQDDRNARSRSRSEVASGFVQRCELSRRAKRTFDITIATAGLLVFSPILIVVSTAIKFDSPGPIFVREKLYGYGNRPVRVFKFRSITDDSGDCALRRAGIAGLPQLFNVLRGDMSIVGSCLYGFRPNRLDEKCAVLDNLKPGMTSMAQISNYCGVVEAPTARRLNADLKYAAQWSLMLDVKIIFMTLLSKKTYLASEGPMRTASDALVD